MNDAVAITRTPLHEKLRIGGEKIDRDERIEVFNPWDNSVVGTVPCATREDVARAFDIAASYTPTLTRYERQQILLRSAEILTSRRDEISDLITAELGISKQDSLYEVGRVFDVFSLAGQLCIIDDG